MAYQQKEGQGSLFKNEKQNDRQPDLKGSIMIKGVLYNVSAWKRTSQNGREYISLQADERPAEGQQPYGQGGGPSYGQRQPGYGGQRQYSAPQPAAAPQYAAPQPSRPAPRLVPDDIPSPGLDDLPAADFGEDLPF